MGGCPEISPKRDSGALAGPFRSSPAAAGQDPPGHPSPRNDYRDARDFMARLRERDDITSKALAFTVLTACRTNEILGAIWDEIDWEARI